MSGREGKRNVSPRAGSFKTVAVLMLIPVGGILLFFFWGFLNGALSAPRRPGGNGNHAEASALGARHRGDIVLILDDVGFDHQPLAAAMAIDPNVNFAVLPNGKRSTEFATTLHGRGFELLCHLPMEPEGFPRISPGEGAVLTTMSDAEIAQATRANVEAVRFARGVNNHMGSRATADRRVMTDVLGALPRGMYFIDSKTTGSSVAGSVARAMRVKTASRNVFLDDARDEVAIRRQLGELAQTAAARGVAVGIGHMYPSTVNVLAEEAPRLRASGFRFLRASEAVE
ncbi:MAG: divergent polysaccharide deacetylase family protein [Acidobacteriota bacterium]|nr:divergent polysaccharide deacetylase family protein [Acidobacteriota bacterium]